MLIALSAIAFALPTPNNLETRSGTRLTQAQAAVKLQADGITTSSSGKCSNKNNRTCTSLDGIFSGTVDGVINLKKISGANIVITGGTEIGHAGGQLSHSNGFKVDLQKNNVLNGFITKTFQQIANRRDGFPQWRDSNKNLYCDEGTHWDITFL